MWPEAVPETRWLCDLERTRAVIGELDTGISVLYLGQRLPGWSYLREIRPLPLLPS